jgi:hypothetical protein
MDSLREIECLDVTNEKPNEQVRISASGVYTKTVSAKK